MITNQKQFKDLTQEEKQQLVSIWNKEDIKYKEKLIEIKEIYGIAERTIYKWLKKLSNNKQNKEHSNNSFIINDSKIENDKLKKEIKLLKLALEDSKTKIKSFKSIEQILHDVKQFSYKKRKLPDFNKLSKKINGVPVLMLSDLHYGETVNSVEIGNINKYDSEIAKNRINYTVDSAIKIVKKDWSVYKTNWFVLTLIGDILSGNIHDELTESNDKRILPSLLEITDILIHQIEKLKQNFNNVYVPAVVGNHGRIHKKFRAKGIVEENYEYIIYKLIEKHFINDKNVIIDVSDSPDKRFDIFNMKFLLSHGNTLGGGGNGIAGILPLLYRGNYKKQERATSINNSYSTLLIGHYHQSLFLNKVIVNGTTKGIDEYALNVLNIPYEKPSQNLFIVDREYNEITYRLPVFCEDSESLEINHTIKTY